MGEYDIREKRTLLGKTTVGEKPIVKKSFLIKKKILLGLL